MNTSGQRGPTLAFTRMEFFDQLGYYPEQVGVRMMAGLTDEFGNNYKGVLLHDPQSPFRIELLNIPQPYCKHIGRCQHTRGYGSATIRGGDIISVSGDYVAGGMLSNPGGTYLVAAQGMS